MLLVIEHVVALAISTAILTAFSYFVYDFNHPAITFVWCGIIFFLAVTKMADRFVNRCSCGQPLTAPSLRKLDERHYTKFDPKVEDAYRWDRDMD